MKTILKRIALFAAIIILVPVVIVGALEWTCWVAGVEMSLRVKQFSALLSMMVGLFTFIMTAASIWPDKI